MNKPYPSGQPASGMATASLVLGIASLLFLCCGASFFFAAPGIVIALLSRGSGEMEGPAKAGLLLSIIGLILSILALAFLFFQFYLFGDLTQSTQEILTVCNGPL